MMVKRSAKLVIKDFLGIGVFIDHAEVLGYDIGKTQFSKETHDEVT